MIFYNMSRKIKYLYIILLIAGAVPGYSQVQGILGKGFTDNWSFGVGAGPNIFFGDLKEQPFWPVTSNMNEVKFGGTATLTKQFSHVFALRGQFLYSELSGTKRDHTDLKPNNEYFNGNVLEGNLNATINFSNLLTKGYFPKRKIFVYGTFGIGSSSWNSNVKQLGTNLPLRLSDSQGAWTTALVAMAGVGAYVNIHDKVNLGIEWTLHGVNSDRVDATVGGYKYDAYSMLAVTLTYNFNKYNPGKEPEPLKVFVPVIQPPVAETKPAESELPEILPATDSIVQDTIADKLDFPAETDTVKAAPGPQEKGNNYRVQIFAFTSDKYTAQEVRDKYHLDQEVYKDFSDGWYRFTIGYFTAYADAKAMKLQMRKRGFKGAFITKYSNGTRVPTHGSK